MWNRSGRSPDRSHRRLGLRWHGLETGHSNQDADFRRFTQRFLKSAKICIRYLFEVYSRTSLFLPRTFKKLIRKRLSCLYRPGERVVFEQ